MPRKVLLDLDPGVGDAVALCLAMALPELDVVAATATGGNVRPIQATRNVQTIVEQVDPQRWPRIGAALPDQVLRTDARQLYGEDGFCGAPFNVAELANRHTSLKVLADEVRAAPGAVTVVAAGPQSNIAAVLRSDPDLATEIGHLILVGGTLEGPGNVTPAAEFNVFCDPESARQVFRSHATKTLIPLDVSSQVVLGYDFLERLRGIDSRTARFLTKVLPGAYRAHRQRLALEGLYVHDAVAVVAAAHPELFTTERLHGDVETAGELTTGATVFDRRRLPDDRPNMDVAVGVDAAGVVDCLHRAFSRAD